MTDLPMTPEQTPDVAETIGFLRRFSDMMATGYNAAYSEARGRSAGKPDRARRRVLG